MHNAYISEYQLVNNAYVNKLNFNGNFIARSCLKIVAFDNNVCIRQFIVLKKLKRNLFKFKHKNYFFLQTMDHQRIYFL